MDGRQQITRTSLLGRFYYSKLTYITKKIAEQTNCLPVFRYALRTDDHILEWHLTLPLWVIEKINNPTFDVVNDVN
jgi:hypothetical protein